MLTPERLAALTAVHDGTVTAKFISAPGHPFRFEPREMQVALGFLERALLIQRDGEFVELSEVGEYVLTKATA